ncbi:unnamed protein product [Rhizophagus irregularis]|nr:unnamed protein product [Rhizophagus irregularis]
MNNRFYLLDFSARCREEHDEEVFNFHEAYGTMDSSLKIIQQIIAYYIKFLHCISEINLLNWTVRFL